MKIRRILEKESFSKVVSESESYKDCIEKLNLVYCGNSYTLVKYWIAKYNLSIEHFNSEKQRLGRSHERIRANQIPLSELMIENSSYSRTCLKKRLYSSGLKKKKCELCGQGETWNGKQMSLILDHVNGVNNDNRLENLRIVCPNCAATLPTHAGKNVKRKKTVV